MSSLARFCLAIFGLLTTTAAFEGSAVLAQTTISTGSIQGTVMDSSGAVVAGATVTVTRHATQQALTVTTTSTGTYASAALAPGSYTLHVQAKGFKSESTEVVVEVGVMAAENIKLQIGQISDFLDVEASATRVNTEQASVQGLLNTEQIDNLPINGRNFLDLAQLEPGVQMQDGGNFDPTKKGFSSISLGGRFGRTARIELDGLDISDETVGTTTQDLPLSAIEEFQIEESMLDLSTELTSSGSVNVVTRSGTNHYHGSGYYYFRDQSLDANLPGASDPPFQRNQFGGNLGGPLVKNKLFVFGDIERTKQDLMQPVLAGPPLELQSGALAAPFRELEGIGKLDYTSKRYKVFYRFSYFQNSDVANWEPIAFQPMDSQNHTRQQAVGLDFTTGVYTHTVRFGYLKFSNQILSGVNSSTPFNPSSPLELAIGPDPLCLNISGAQPDVFCSGQPFLTPQYTDQSDHQVKYDGGRTFRSHILRYGIGFNHIQGWSFAPFLVNGAAVGAGTSACSGACLTLPGGAGNALNYPAQNVLLGNGLGFSTTQPAFGSPAGGLGPDNRVYWYVGDSWKIKPNVTMTYGLRYVRDTGRTDSDLAPIAALNQFDNQFYSDLGARINNPNKNFAPQIGVAWDPTKNGKTVLRGGIGLFYENSLWNNVLFDRPARLPTGEFLGFQPACGSGSPVTFTLPGTSTSITPNFCNQPIVQVQPQIAALQSRYQAASIAFGAASNPSYIGTALADTGVNGTGTNLFAPDFRTPRSVQMNFGIQREVRPGIVFTADYVRNISTHTLLAVDTNHVGDARFFNLANAQAAISTTDAKLACGGGFDQTTIQCAINKGATISSYAGNGLDSGYSFCGGGPCPKAAFPGINPNLGGNQMLFPIGRSLYNGLQMSLKQDLHDPFKGVRYANFQVSYALSRYMAQANDSDFINSAWNYANPSRYIGPTGLDRTQQISIGGTLEFPAHFQAGIVGHFDSGLPVTLTLATTGQPGGIFVTAVNGDGTGDGSPSNGSNGSLGGILPGTNLGSFGRGVNSSNLNTVINNYNSDYAGKPTPAGQVLLDSSLFNLNQLRQLGGVMPTVNSAPSNQAFNTWLRDLDLNLSWTHQVREGVEVRPGVSFFNLFNFVNFDPPKNTISGVLSSVGTVATVGTANGTPGEQPKNLRYGLGSGVFGLGSPRVVEFSLKLTF
jgi:hypothetical protein